MVLKVLVHNPLILLLWACDMIHHGRSMWPSKLILLVAGKPQVKRY